MTHDLAPELEVADWLNAETPLTLKSLRGRIVLVEAFQMLCPGCVAHSLPQAMKVAQTFRYEDVAVIGLHSVFEHHAGQGRREALTAFLHEYRITFPVAMDTPRARGPIPKTMEKYQMRGTPSLLLIDREGYLREHLFGRVDDMTLGAKIMAIIKEPSLAQETPSSVPQAGDECKDSGCTIPT